MAVSIIQSGSLGLGGMVSVSELSSKRRKVEEAKDTDRLQPKKGSSRLFLSILGIHEQSTAGVIDRT